MPAYLIKPFAFDELRRDSQSTAAEVGACADLVIRWGRP
jgi:hypothetical protein